MQSLARPIILAMLEALQTLIERGGPVMWPLIGLSILGMALSIERAWVFFMANRGSRIQRLKDVTRAIRSGNREAADRFAKQDKSVYGALISEILDAPISESSGEEAVDEQRMRLERFLPLLSTIITAAPMLGILGTVLGIIEAFQGMSQQEGNPDMAQVGAAIGEALISTAAGIVVALLVLLPHATFRSQIARATSRMENLASAAVDGLKNVSK